MNHVFDVAIVGGGINGCGCAADAAQRGLSVFLCEQGDLASQTSSSSTKLIHGGLRYLEHLNFSLVKKALDERQRLLQLAPHLVHPKAIVLPYKKGMRSIKLLRAGLFLYDRLSLNNQLPKSKHLIRQEQPDYFAPLQTTFTTGLCYFDCMADDARLTLVNALLAKEHGAQITPYTRLTHVKANHNGWTLTCHSQKDNTSFQIQAKTLINAAGPWVNEINQQADIPIAYDMRFVKGSHFLLPALYEGDHGYLLQHDDKRVVFVLPYHGYSLVGTTDVEIPAPTTSISINQEEINYLLELVKSYFQRPVTEKDIIHQWSGIRPLLATPGHSPQAISRDYVSHLTHQPAPAVTLYSGKITTYRLLAKQAIDKLKPFFPHLPPSPTANTALPGAVFNQMNFTQYQAYAQAQYHWLDRALLARYLATYGTQVEQLLSHCKTQADLGQCFAPELYQVEVDYLMREEWACTPDDILWRRTRLGLRINLDERQALVNYLTQKGYQNHVK